MKKAVICILILGVGLGIYFKFKEVIEGKITMLSEKRLDIEGLSSDVEELYVYGRSFNLKGSIQVNDINFDSFKLVLYNNEFQYYDLIYEKEVNTVHYEISNKLNTGIILDTIDVGSYYLFIEIGYDIDGESVKKYYPIKNTTGYEQTAYYTLSNVHKKVTISSEESYPTMLLSVVENKDNEVYDIVIDPGHGGLDSGAVNGKYYEKDLTYELALLLKEKLEKYGFKVKLTHNGDIPLNEVLDYYGNSGRAVIPQKVGAKYLLSLHFNSSSAEYVNGLEIYTADNIDYRLAKALADNLVKNTDIDYSNNSYFKIYNGIYTHNFTESEIKESTKEMENAGRTPYSITTKSNYFYMIRETGGYMTGAYVDDKNPDTVGVNPYYHSNVGVEAYILELGFITSNDDLMNFINNKEKYADAIGDTLYSLVK